MSAVTVVTCTFGRPDGLRRVIASLATQTFRDFRHLIVEDAGNTPSIHDMHLSGPILMTMKHRTGWPGFVCRNEAVKIAETELVAFLDDDNWYDPEHLDILVSLQETTTADFVWSSTRLWSPSGDLIGCRRSDIPVSGRIDINEILVKRALFVGGGGLDPRDQDIGDGRMVDRWVRYGARFAHSDAVTLNYTVNDSDREALMKKDCANRVGGYSFVEA